MWPAGPEAGLRSAWQLGCDAPGHLGADARMSTGVLLAPGLVHLTYETTLKGNRARRSSLWRKQGADAPWQMYYHQATPIPPGTV